MKKKLVLNAVSLLMASALTGAVMVGCGSVNGNTGSAPKQETASEEKKEEPAAETTEAAEVTEAADSTAEVPAAPYFAKGVYANYSEELDNPNKDYFYVFSDDNYGYTADGANNGIGLPFDVTQTDGKVVFTFGGADESEDTLVVTAVENGVIHGYFEDIPERPMVFEPVEGADPESFSAENTVNGPEESVYHDANGWSVKYDATRFEVNQGGPVTTFVYVGDSAGTNMITATYTVDNNAEGAIKELGASYGDGATYTEGSFPGAEDVTGYWVSTPVDKEGSGSYMTAVARDYMDGALVFELDGHMGNDDEQNMEVSDSLAMVIDSLTFDN
jgi:hypothetical protein